MRDPAGFGAELKTAHGLALRAGRGMLLSTDAAPADGAQLDAAPAASQIAQSAQLAAGLAARAHQHNARLKDEGEPGDLAALRDLERSARTLQAQTDGAASAGAVGGGGGGGATIAYGEPQLQLSTPAGLAVLTPGSAVVGAGASSMFAAGRDINFAAQAG